MNARHTWSWSASSVGHMCLCQVIFLVSDSQGAPVKEQCFDTVRTFKLCVKPWQMRGCLGLPSPTNQQQSSTYNILVTFSLICLYSCFFCCYWDWCLVWFLINFLQFDKQLFQLVSFRFKNKLQVWSLKLSPPAPPPDWKQQLHEYFFSTWHHPSRISGSMNHHHNDDFIFQ